MGRQPSALVADHTPRIKVRRRSGADPAPLLGVPVDVWLHILSHLEPAMLAAFASLSRTCRRLLHLVDQHAWRLVLTHLYPTISAEALAPFHRRYVREARQAGRSSRLPARSLHWYACRHASTLHTTWSGVVVSAHSIDLPSALYGKAATRARRFGADFAIPTLALGELWTAVGVRSELLLSRTSTEPTAALSFQVRVQLDSCAEAGTLLAHVQNRPEGTRDDPWLDVTALYAADSAARKLVVGYADGAVQLLEVRSSDEIEVTHVFRSDARHEIAAVSVLRQPREGEGEREVRGSVLVASLSKRGRLRIHDLGAETGTGVWQIDADGTASACTGETPVESTQSSGAATPRQFRSAAFNNAPLEADAGTRAWSVLLGQHTSACGAERWIAVGLTGEHAVYVYPLRHHEGGLRLGEPMYVASTGQRTSVYALASAPPQSNIPSFLLFVGGFDGAVRVYDLRALDAFGMSALSDSLDPAQALRRRRRASRQLDPIAVLRDSYDSDAVYSLAFGGPRAQMLLVGGARHAKVRNFHLDFLEHYSVPLLSGPSATHEARDWTAFALPTTDSPQYALAAQPHRLLGLTDRKLWQLNFATPLLEPRPSPPIAYFRHADAALAYSSSSPPTL